MVIDLFLNFRFYVKYATATMKNAKNVVNKAVVFILWDGVT